jgi:CRP-like cAMP-binding protein
MSGILELVNNYPVRQFDAGEIVLDQGHDSGVMLVLIEGEVEILRDEVCVATASQPGVVFGEMSTLLGGPHTATVRARTRSCFAVVENPRRFLEDSAQASLFVAEMLARRLDALNKYLIDVKRQYEGHDHIGMVDDVLETLMHLPPRPAGPSGLPGDSQAGARQSPPLTST